MTVHYVTGYNDIFHNMAARYCNSLVPGGHPPYKTELIPADRAMQAAKDSGAQMVRCNVQWEAIETSVGDSNWKAAAGAGEPDRVRRRPSWLDS